MTEKRRVSLNDVATRRKIVGLSALAGLVAACRPNTSPTPTSQAKVEAVPPTPTEVKPPMTATPKPVSTIVPTATRVFPTATPQEIQFITMTPLPTRTSTATQTKVPVTAISSPTNIPVPLFTSTPGGPR